MSVLGGRIVHMFEGWGPGALIGELEVCQRQESVLIARRMAVIAQLLAHRVGEAEDVDPDPGYSMISGFARTAAEVAAVMNMTPMAATEVVAHAEALDVRLPAIAGLLAAGRIDGRSAALIITRTELVSVDRIAEVDSRLAARIGGWSSWSRRRLIIAVDSAVHAVDPDAVKQRRVAAHDERFLRVAADADGMARVRGSVPATAGAALDARLSELAGAVCAADPRTMAQRRADALLALVQGRVLGCGCPRPDCPTRTPADPGDSAAAPAGGVRTVISVIATGSTVAGDSDQPGYLQGYGVIDAAQVRALAGHAALRILEQPTVSAAQAVRYQPGAALQRWIRARDLTCRFPGCDRPAALCDIDHTIPFNHDDPAAGGLTVPDNLACYCRQHHRLKTFYAGPGGWRDEQLPDGTLVWTSPTGHVELTRLP
jgi:uncharacterized protein DUF222